MARRCTLLLVSLHSFPMPDFYEQLGFQRQAVVVDHPPGHMNIVLAKRLPAAPS